MQTTVFAILYILFLFVTLRRILLDVKHPAKAFSWILVVIFLPFLGLLFFYLLGNSLKKDKFFNQRSAFYNTTKQKIKIENSAKSKTRIAQLLNENESSSISYSNEIKVLTNNQEIYKNLFSDIRNAKRSIHLEFYIIESGQTLDSILKLLQFKIKEGVKVRIIWDGYGSIGLNKKLIRKMENLGIECHKFMPFSIWGYLRFMNYRNHRKMIIIDNEISYTGGMNISDNYLNKTSSIGIWKDVFIRIKGLASKDFEKVFQTDWFYAGGDSYNLENSKKNKINGIPIQIVASGPDSKYQGILHEYFSIITDAQEYAYIITPYFIPGEVLLTALKTSALSGIDIRLMLPYNSDSKWLKWSMFTYLEELLASGVKIYLHHEGFLHSKIMISDDCLASIGTANVDERSFNTNFEINSIAYDQDVTLKLREYFFDEMKHCEELKLSNFSSRKDRNKILESIARLTSPFL